MFIALYWCPLHGIIAKKKPKLRLVGAGAELMENSGSFPWLGLTGTVLSVTAYGKSGQLRVSRRRSSYKPFNSAA